MSDNKVSKHLQSNAPPETKASVSGGASSQQVVLSRKSPAMAYWQGVAAAGRAAKPLDEARERQTPGQRSVVWARP
jgi:hypothetical protein